MTIIEFFDKEMLDNIIGTLIYEPERVVLLGRDLNKLQSIKSDMEAILAEKKIKTEILTQQVNTSDFSCITEKLNELIDTYPDCVFDLTGGEGLILVAMGAVSQKRKITMHTICPKRQKVKTIKSGIQHTEWKNVSLSPSQAVELFGGNLATGLFGTEKLCKFKINETSVRDITAIWHICRNNPADWNTAIDSLSSIVDIHGKKRGLSFTLPKNYFKQKKNTSHKVLCLQNILSKLILTGIISEEITKDSRICTFKNFEMLEILTKSGNALELYTLLSVLKTQKSPGVPLVKSAVSGAVIDWKNPYVSYDDVINEIDVFAMSGVIPVFISCKNGGVDSNELYKLNTVAEKFGGKYAKKILVMTNANVRDSFIKRANAMDIKLIKNTNSLSLDEFIKKLENSIIH